MQVNDSRKTLILLTLLIAAFIVVGDMTLSACNCNTASSAQPNGGGISG